MSNRIKILERSVALKIAAGEVIERPSSVLREVLDNSIDADSSEINVYLTSSGMEEIRVIDNGSGMTREDLEICFLPHATSKIEQIEDIYRIWTLGFRGEALSSIASSARTEIISSTDESGEGCKLKIDGEKHEITNSRANKGTIVSVKELFHMFPARKNFLKSPSAETTLCKTTFLEKAASNPDITFRLFIENKLIHFLPASSLAERITLCYPAVFKELKMCSIIEYSEPSFSIKGILNSPELTRKDRKYIHIYINGRRIQEYSLVQAVTYGYSNFIPGGVFPSAVIFINIDPQLVDFNIHPAKKEARIKNNRIIHHALSETVAGKLKSSDTSGRLELNRNIFTSPMQQELTASEGIISEHRHIQDDHNFSGKNNNELSEYYDDESKSSITEETQDRIFRKDKYNGETDVYKNASETINTNYTNHAKSHDPGKISFISDLKGNIQESENDINESNIILDNCRYIGSLFNLFLICEKDDNLYLIDQHAADERIIYEKLCSRKPEIQPLLIPLYPESDLMLTDKIIKDYEELGIIIKKDDTGDYFIDAMPAYYFEIKNDILKILTESPGNTDEIRKNLFATVSCQRAVKKGDNLSAEQAEKIIRGAFNLELPFCPHGRPIWKKITKNELLEEINRIV